MVDSAAGRELADTRLLQAVHKTFRLATNRFVDATAKLEPADLAPVIGSRWRFYSDILHFHHHNEDDKEFPALVAVRPDLKDLVDKLEDDHRQLVSSMEAVDKAVAEFEKHPDSAHQEVVHDAIAAVRDAFFPHLDVEDAQIIPAFASSMDPREWDRMDKEALKSIPRQHLPTAIGALDEVIRSLPEDQWPPPPPIPIRALLALSWRKRWAAFIKPMVV